MHNIPDLIRYNLEEIDQLVQEICQAVCEDDPALGLRVKEAQKITAIIQTFYGRPTPNYIAEVNELVTQVNTPTKALKAVINLEAAKLLMMDKIVDTHIKKDKAA